MRSFHKNALSSSRFFDIFWGIVVKHSRLGLLSSHREHSLEGGSFERVETSRHFSLHPRGNDQSATRLSRLDFVHARGCDVMFLNSFSLSLALSYSLNWVSEHAEKALKNLDASLAKVLAEVRAWDAVACCCYYPSNRQLLRGDGPRRPEETIQRGLN